MYDKTSLGMARRDLDNSKRRALELEGERPEIARSGIV